MANLVLESLDHKAREWASQFDFVEVGDCVHLTEGEPKWGHGGGQIDSESLFSSEQRTSFHFLSALESFVNHQHPFHQIDLGFLPDLRLYSRRLIELCAAHLQRRAEETVPHRQVCVIPERYNEVITVVTVRPGNTARVDELAACLGSADDEVRYEAATAAGTYMVREVVDDLVRAALEDPCIDVSTAASESLIELADKRSLPPMRNIWMKQEGAEHVVRTAAFLLATFGEIDSLLAGIAGGRLQGDDWAEVVVHLPAAIGALPLIHRLLPLAESSADLRWALGEAIASIGPTGLRYAAGLLKSADAAVRQVGCLSLFRPQAKGWRLDLEEALQSDPSSEVRYAAFASLEQMASPESFGPLIAALADSGMFGDVKNSGGGIARFVRRNPQLDIRPLLALFGSDDPDVRLRVIQSLEEIESGEQRLDARPRVADALDDPDPDIRAWAIYITSVLNFTDLRERIQFIAWTDPDDTVRDEAEQTLADWLP